MSERIRIPIEECKDGVLYRIFSRNLAFGVYREGVKGFVGIREKFGYEYLFTEFHWDTGPPFGTVNPKEELEPVPEGMCLNESLGSVGEKTRRPVEYFSDWRYRDTGEVCNEAQGWDDKDGAVGEESRRPIKQGENKGHVYVDTKEPIKDEYAMSEDNKELFNWLKEKEKQYRKVEE